MATIITPTDSLPPNAASARTDEGDWALLWVRHRGQVSRLQRASEGDAPGRLTYASDPEPVVRDHEMRPLLPTLPPSDLRDWAIKRHERLFSYWITAPADLQPGIQRFVAAAEEGGLPPDWTTHPAEDGAGDAHVVCSFTLTFCGAASLGAEQDALGTLASLPANVHFFQCIADIEGYSGLERVSRQPTELPAQVYAPGTLFQTSHPDAASDRSSKFTESDVLTTTGLTLV